MEKKIRNRRLKFDADEIEFHISHREKKSSKRSHRRKPLKEMLWDDPLGQKVPEEEDDSKNPTVVGVVRDFHFDSMEDEIMPLVMHMNPNRNSIWSLFARINAANVSGSLDDVRESWNTVAPDRPLNYTFLDESLEDQYNSEERWSKIIGYGSGFSIIISSLGYCRWLSECQVSGELV